MISVHHLECSRSFRILWALEELGLDYDIHYYQRLPNYSAPETLKCIHPLGKAPILTDDEQVIAESAVILDICSSDMIKSSNLNLSKLKIYSSIFTGCTMLKVHLCRY
jgi:hypothetical protein